MRDGVGRWQLKIWVWRCFAWIDGGLWWRDVDAVHMKHAYSQAILAFGQEFPDAGIELISISRVSNEPLWVD
jgi:hypothetical protein